MKTLLRVAAFAVIALIVHATQTWWLARIQPESSTSRAVRQLNGDDADAAAVRWFETEKNLLELAGAAALIAAAALLFQQPLRRAFARSWRQRALTLPLLLLTSSLTGCIRPYDRPEFVTIDTAETGFLIPLEGDGKKQDKFASEDYLAQLKVASKRVQIPHRWQQTGRMSCSGQWMPTVRLIKVERSPVTREWTADPSSGTAAKNQAIWIESADSVAFSMGFTCTAFIPEEQAARFLYWYPTGALAHVMDLEVRARIQQVAAEIAAMYPLDNLRTRKQEIMDGVRKDVTTFFSERGITVTTIGMFGGMTYENPEIQKAIDKAFIAQQEKVVNVARFEAQQHENERIELEADGMAEKERRKAQGEADAKETIAGAEARAIREVNSALAETQQSPMWLQLKQLEVEKARVEKWGGAYPQYYLAPGEKTALLFPAPAAR